MTKCLDKAKKDFKELLGDQEIKDVHDTLMRYRNNALKTGKDLQEALRQASETLGEEREAALKAAQLRELISMQGTVDNLARIGQFAEAGIKNPIKNALYAKIFGTMQRIMGGRLSTELKINQARTKMLIEFTNRLHADGTYPIWTSHEYQTEIADAVMRLADNQEVKDPMFRKIGQMVLDFQDRYRAALQSVGVDVSKLHDRVSPNVHDMDKLRGLSIKEQFQLLGEDEKVRYEYTRDRWKSFIKPLLDNARILAQSGFDLDDAKQSDDFLNYVYDELVNKGKESQERQSLVARLGKPRQLHWKNADAMVKYQQEFGAGSIQNAISSELINGFSKIELYKDWGVNPVATLGDTLKLVDLDPEMKKRFDKDQEARKLKSLLTALSGSPTSYSGSIGNFMRNVRAIENIAKLGLVTLRSEPDLGLLAMEASRSGMNGFQAIGEGVATFLTNLHPEVREIFADMLETHHTHEIGSVLKYDLADAKHGSLAQKAMRASNKANFIQPWDLRLRGAALAIWSRYFARNRKIAYEALSDDDQARLGAYNIDAPHYDLIRSSQLKIADGKEYITPDSIESMPDSDVRAIMDKHGVDIPLSKFREQTVSRFRSYLTDRQNQVILRPGVRDQYIVALGANVNEMSNGWQEFFKLISQFKLYAINYSRNPLASVIYGKGARSFKEATLHGKADFQAMGKLMMYMMSTKYASMAAANAVQGLSPPSLDKPDTWIKMMQEAGGLYGMMADISPTDLSGSLLKAVEGPVIGDADKASRLLYHLFDDSLNQDDYERSTKAAMQLGRGFVPKYPWSAFVVNNMMMGNFEEMVSPGSRDRYLDQLEQRTGSMPLM